MYKVAETRPDRNDAVLVVRSAGQRVIVPSLFVEAIFHWDSAPVRTAVADDQVGIISNQEAYLQIFRLQDQMACPKWHLAPVKAQWTIVLQINENELGLLVDELLGWGYLLNEPTNRTPGGYKTEVSVSLYNGGVVSGEPIDVRTMFGCPVKGRYFYV